MAVHQVYPELYRDQLAAKVEKTTAEFRELQAPELEVFESPTRHYRMRAEFSIWHGESRSHYAMFEPGQRKKAVVIEDFPVAGARINQLMPDILAFINSSELLRLKLFQVEFLTSTTGEAVVTLIYHRRLDEAWQDAVETIAGQLSINIIGRSRKQKIVIGKDFVNECFNVAGETFHYRQVESAFSQPNAAVCEKMLNWASGVASGLGGDLLELYCGNGNFTLPLARRFGRVLATEVSKASVATALQNAARNVVENVDIVRMSSEEFAEAYTGKRPFRRLKHIDLNAFAFTTLFVDPPRAGLDEATLTLAQDFQNILYISCNPETLRQNARALSATHTIERFALFDQFPYTDHRECGLLLTRR